eukprot:SAG31_NODE_2922_length_4906_cov_8.279800_4_plen_406_part_00
MSNCIVSLCPALDTGKQYNWTYAYASPQVPPRDFFTLCAAVDARGICVCVASIAAIFARSATADIQPGRWYVSPTAQRRPTASPTSLPPLSANPSPTALRLASQANGSSRNPSSERRRDGGGSFGEKNGSAAATKASPVPVDRWHNSGGSKNSRDLPTGEPRPLVKRRYGAVEKPDGERGFSYHEYVLLRVDESSQQVNEDRTHVLYHVMPKRESAGQAKSTAELVETKCAAPPKTKGSGSVSAKQKSSAPARVGAWQTSDTDGKQKCKVPDIAEQRKRSRNAANLDESRHRLPLSKPGAVQPGTKSIATQMASPGACGADVRTSSPNADTSQGTVLLQLQQHTTAISALSQQLTEQGHVLASMRELVKQQQQMMWVMMQKSNMTGLLGTAGPNGFREPSSKGDG